MTRAKNEEQKEYKFSCVIDLRINDINFAGHVGNSQMIGIAHDARIRLLKDLGLSEGNLGDGKTGIVVADITANLMAEVFPDDSVVVKSHVGDISEKGFRIFHKIESNGRRAALIETGIVAFDYNKRAATPVPEIFKQRLKEYRKT